ncbi:hypothetical protein CRENBAI_002695 [Crenichthys baileyi]|uniref:Uncharacterized protein n=1 Tax=Crenichthys baileyi TaxID=28760 RepID=A0AAV9S1Z7_9TELE
MDPNEEAHWGISSEQMTELAGDHDVGICIYILDCNKYSALNSWRNTEHTSDCLPLSRLYFPHHFCPPTELVQQSSLTFLDPFMKGFPNQNNQTGPTFHTKDIFYWIKNFLKEATQPHTFVMDTFNRFIILSDNCISINKLCGIYSSQNLRKFIKYRGSSGSDNKTSVIKHGSAQRSSCLVTSCEDADRDYLSTCKPKSHHKSSRNDEHPRRPWRRDETETMKTKKSVTFEEDVIVYLFDQETPTIKLESEPCTPLPFSYPCHLPDVMSEDNDLQWEDDFSALEVVRQPATVSLQTNGWTSRTSPECYSLSQTCLFLTYVMESDLEL